MNDILDMSHISYSEIISNEKFKMLSTSELNKILGIKFLYTYLNESDSSRWYKFEILDPKKLILYRIEYGF